MVMSFYELKLNARPPVAPEIGSSDVNEVFFLLFVVRVRCKLQSITFAYNGKTTDSILLTITC